jgi:ribosome-binding protein aMBF1 (putative translation factor)
VTITPASALHTPNPTLATDRAPHPAASTLSRRRQLQAERSSDERRILESIAERVRHARQRRRWTQRELAQRAGLNPSQIATLEAGMDNATVLTLSALARALRCSISTLVRGT